MHSLLTRLSIIIVTYKGDDLLKQCLASLANACGNEPEIIVVDNSKSTETEAIVKAYSNTKYIASETNLGFAGGNNLGLPHCTREYVLLLNNDIIVHEEPFSQLIQYLIDNSHVGVVSGTMNLPKMGDILEPCGLLQTRIGELLPLNQGLPTANTKCITRPVFSIKGANMLFRRNLIDKLNGVLFYDHFISFYEESDFCHRVWLSGHEVHFVDTTPIDHLSGQTAKNFNKHDLDARLLANLEFSLSTTLDSYGIFTIMLWHKVYIFLLLLSALILRKKSVVYVISTAKKINKTRKAEIRKTRKQLQSTRLFSDKYIFSKTYFSLPIYAYPYFIQGRYKELNEIVERSK